MTCSHNAYEVSFRQALQALAEMEHDWLEMLKQGILPRHEVHHAIAALTTGKALHVDIKRDDENGMFADPHWVDSADMMDIVKATVAGQLAPVADMSDDEAFLSNISMEMKADSLEWCEIHVLPKLRHLTDATLIRMIAALDKHGSVRLKPDLLH